MQILEGRSVTKHFGGLAAVHQVDFGINQGDVVGLIGPNGAGKTTLFNLISGSLPTTGGEIRYKGKKITGLKPHQICKSGVARTFQSAKLFAGMTVFENALAASLFGTKRAISVPDAERETAELLEFVELSTVKEIPARDLAINRIIVAGEPGGSIAATRAAIEMLWKAQVVDFYGISDIFGACAGMCGERDGSPRCQT